MVESNFPVLVFALILPQICNLEKSKDSTLEVLESSDWMAVAVLEEE